MYSSTLGYRQYLAGANTLWTNNPPLRSISSVHTDELKTAIGKTVRKLRSDQGYSQEGFADAVGLHRTYLGHIERGQTNIGVGNLALIASTLGISLSDLMSLVEKEAGPCDREVSASK